jgi:hypothetical protein
MHHFDTSLTHIVTNHNILQQSMTTEKPGKLHLMAISANIGNI